MGMKPDLVLRIIFGPKRDEVTGQWKKLHSEELHNLYSSPYTIRQIKSRRKRWAGHVVRMGEDRKMYRHHWEDRGVDRRMGSKWLVGGFAEGRGVECI
jgi:hypothetical protein